MPSGFRHLDHLSRGTQHAGLGNTYMDVIVCEKNRSLCAALTTGWRVAAARCYCSLARLHARIHDLRARDCIVSNTAADNDRDLSQLETMLTGGVAVSIRLRFGANGRLTTRRQ
jgi:hypothetical protein